MSVVLIEMLGHEKVANAYGIVAFFNGLANLVGPPVLSKWDANTFPIYIECIIVLILLGQFTLKKNDNTTENVTLFSTTSTVESISSSTPLQGFFSKVQTEHPAHRDTYTNVILISGIMIIISAVILLRIAFQFKPFDSPVKKKIDNGHSCGKVFSSEEKGTGYCDTSSTPAPSSKMASLNLTFGKQTGKALHCVLRQTRDKDAWLVMLHLGCLHASMSQLTLLYETTDETQVPVCLVHHKQVIATLMRQHLLIWARIH